MGPKDKELLKKLLATFRVEAEEHLKAISAGLLKLERASTIEERLEVIEIVFREAHSLKGAARAVNQVQIESACQSLESVFADLKTQQIPLSPERFDQFHQAIDAIIRLLAESNAEQPFAANPGTLPPAQPFKGPTVFLSKMEVPGPPSDKSTGPAASEISRPVRQAPQSTRTDRFSETLRVPTSKLDLLLRQAEELLPAKATATQRMVELQDIAQALALWEAEWGKLQPHIRSIERVLNGTNGNGRTHSSNGQGAFPSHIAKLLSFVERDRTMVRSIQGGVSLLSKRLDDDRRAFERRVDDLLEETKQLSTIPFSTLLELFPKLVRDLCRDCGKDAELIITGGEIEADRRILEEIKDALVHLVRNSVDHGIETARQREEMGKPSRATITMAICPKDADKVEVIVSDDGAGIDLHRVRASAAKAGVVSEEDAQKIGEQETAALIFKSGISTSPMITEVSGRGLGLAIVREKAEKVGGSVAVETQSGRGTTFRLTLPLIVARFRGVIVRASDRLLVVPTRHVQRLIRVSPDEIRSAENRETIEVNGQPTSAVWLADVLEIVRTNKPDEPNSKIPAVVLTWAGEQIAFFVDEIIGEQEVLVKSLGKQLPRVRNLSGAALLGTGKVLPVLNVADLMRSAVTTVRAPSLDQAKETPKAILVAEDSITARTLLKNILELAGYKVKTTVDGAEAFSALANEDFDLVVSDVEMPRMSGFDLTARIRSDKKLAQLPVVLVTALASREDRERGLDAGANAYIVKSSFDQGNLLEVVRRLI